MDIIENHNKKVEEMDKENPLMKLLRWPPGMLSDAEKREVAYFTFRGQVKTARQQVSLLELSKLISEVLEPEELKVFISNLQKYGEM